MANIEIIRSVQTIAEAHEVIAHAKALGGTVRKLEACRDRWEDNKPVNGFREEIANECDILDLRRKTATIEADGNKLEMRPVFQPEGLPKTGALIRITITLPSYT